MPNEKENKPQDQPKQSKVFVNPLAEGMTHEEFLKAIPSGVSIKEYCAGQLTEEQIEALEQELNFYHTNQK